MKHVSIYTDGGCSPNPGPGGYGIVMIYESVRKELSGGYRRTTNNRMELIAVILGLESLKEPCRIRLFSDSQYVVNGISKGWARKWQTNGWRLADKRPAENQDLWQRLLDLCETHYVEFEWVRGHDGNVENEVCDQLATAARQRDLSVDTVYETNQGEFEK